MARIDTRAYEPAETLALPGEVSTGPALSPLDAMAAAYDAQVRANSQFGLEVAYRQIEQEQNAKIRALGGQAPASLNDSDDGTFFGGMTGGLDSRRYTEMFRAADENDLDKLARITGDRDKQYEALRSQYPDAGILTTGEMRDLTMQRARTALRRNDQRVENWASSVFGFIGEAAGSLDVRTNPLNFATLPLGGGIGRTALGRIGLDAGIAAGSEAASQFGGVRETRDLLGVPNSTLGDVVLAGVAGAGFSGLAEGVMAAGRWFRHTPTDPAPQPPSTPLPVPAQGTQIAPGTIVARPRTALDDNLDRLFGPARSPLATSPLGRTRSVQDYAYVRDTLDSWGAPRPWELPPQTSAALPGLPETTVSLRSETREAIRASTVDESMRVADPEVMRAWDTLASNEAAIRADLSALEKRTADGTANKISKVNKDIAALDRQLRQSGISDEVFTPDELDTALTPRARALYDQRETLKAQRAKLIDEVRKTAGEEEAGLRLALVQNEQLRWSMHDVMQRTAARARNEWEEVGSPLYEQIQEMIARGAPSPDIERRGQIVYDAKAVTKFSNTKQYIDTSALLAAKRDIDEALLEGRDVKFITGGKSRTITGKDGRLYVDSQGNTHDINSILKPGTKDRVKIGPEPEKPPTDLPPELPNVIYDRIADGLPGIHSTPFKPGETIAQKVSRMGDERAEVSDTVTEQFRSAGVRDMAKQLEDQGFIEINGARINAGDEISIEVDASGNVQTTTVRDVLKSIDDDNAAIQAISACSIVKPSQTA